MQTLLTQCFLPLMVLNRLFFFRCQLCKKSLHQRQIQNLATHLRRNFFAKIVERQELQVIWQKTSLQMLDLSSKYASAEIKSSRKTTNMKNTKIMLNLSAYLLYLDQKGSKMSTQSGTPKTGVLNFFSFNVFEYNQSSPLL